MSRLHPVGSNHANRIVFNYLTLHFFFVILVYKIASVSFDRTGIPNHFIKDIVFICLIGDIAAFTGFCNCGFILCGKRKDAGTVQISGHEGFKKCQSLLVESFLPASLDQIQRRPSFRIQKIPIILPDQSCENRQKRFLSSPILLDIRNYRSQIIKPFLVVQLIAKLRPERNLTHSIRDMLHIIVLPGAASVILTQDIGISKIYKILHAADKIKNTFFELIVTANNTTREKNKNFTSDTFDNAFATLSSENDIKLIKEFAQKFLTECTQAISSVKKADENPVIKKVCAYVDENLASDISLATAADFAGLSSFYLSKLFKEEKGETFINFISEKRLEKSRQLLEETELSIKEITAEVGYNDQNYFSRIFKSKYGLSPKEYRKVK